MKYARDGVAVVGLVLFGVGCWLLSPAAALMVVGGLLLAAAVWGHLNAAE